VVSGEGEESGEGREEVRGRWDGGSGLDLGWVGMT
jgi:hypothetical protein